MARSWLSVTVELLGGGGQDLWPWPGRIFAVGPRHTFADLADAINGAFARWDRSHLSMFTLADGTVVTDGDTGAEMAETPGGPLLAVLDMERATVARTVGLGAEFQFTFDLGDNWTHRCTVAEKKVDPDDVLGIVPPTPLPYWGWGSIPDQYGRRWSGDDGESPMPPRPASPHPMVLHTWPAQRAVPALDLAEVRASVAQGDVTRFLAALAGRDIDDALQQVAAGIPMALRSRRTEAVPIAVSIINRLTSRSAEGDQVLADDLLALLRREPLPGRVLPVDLDELSFELEGDPSASAGGFLDLRDGQVYPSSAADPDMVGEDAAIDLDEDPDRWLGVRRTGSRDGWRDMEDFATRQRDEVLRQRLLRSIEGSGAFRRFRDAVHQAGMAEQWYAFYTDRKFGRAREFLADNDIHVG